MEEIGESMGDISVIARRLKDGTVQYGWSGNGGYFGNTGIRLLAWYNEKKEEIIENLFSLGQLSRIGEPGSENGGESWMATHGITGKPHYIGKSEREIFSKILFIDYGYFYDIDQQWYYVKPGPFRIKIPLELILKNLDNRGYEFEFLKEVQEKLVQYMFQEYALKDDIFKEFLESKNIDKIYEELINDEYPIYTLWEKYRDIANYFDDWVLVKADSMNKNVETFVIQKKSDVHVETINW